MKLDALERELPPATLLLGPDVPGMVRTARAVVRDHGVVPADLIVSRVTAPLARVFTEFAGTAPFGPFKAVIAALDGATAQAQNILLKVLEEPPPGFRFILVATARPLPTITSRCQVITVQGEAGPPEADQKVTAQVAAALSAACAGDLRVLEQALDGWGGAQYAVLEAQMAMAATCGGKSYGLTQAQARRLLGALGRFNGAHPRLAAHAALVTILSDKEQHA